MSDFPCTADHAGRRRLDVKALTLWQPWASLIAIGAKTIETRGWPTSYRGPLLIHASVTLEGLRSLESDYEDGWAVGALEDTPHVFCWQRIDGEMVVHRYNDGDGPHPVPLGAAVATCTLADVVQTDRILFGEADGWSGDRKRLTVLPSQRPYGDYAPGGYAWLLADVRPLASPVPAKGKQGLWTPDADLIATVEAAS